MLEDHRHLAIKIAIEEIDQHPRWLTIGECGEPAHVGEPDRCVDLLDIAAPDPPGEDALAGVVADIGVEQGARVPPPCADLGDPRQRRHDRLDTGDLFIGETARLPRRAGDHVNGAVCEEQRQSQVIGHPLGTEFLQDREVHRATRVGEPAAQRSAGRVDAGDGVFPELRRIKQPEPAFRDFDLGARAPDKPPADNLRMQGVYKHGDPP